MDATEEKSQEIMAGKFLYQNGCFSNSKTDKIEELGIEFVDGKDVKSQYSSLSHEKLNNSDSFILEVVGGRMTPNTDDEKE